MSSVNGLSSYFTSLISDLMQIEAQPLYALQTRQQNLNSQKTDYSSARSELVELRDAVKELIASSPLTQLKASRSVSIADTQDDTTVASATSSSYAVAGDYQLNVSGLARAQQRVSATQSSMDLALGKSGSIWLGGTGSASVNDFTANDSITSATTGTVANGLDELGASDQYKIQVRDFNGVLKFRLVDVDEQAVAIDDLSKSDSSQTTNWQVVNAGSTVDTGRGLVFTFGDTVSAGDTAVNYTAAGVQVAIDAQDSLVDIGNKINEAAQPEGHAVVASVVGKNLVLTAKESGLNHRMIYHQDGIDLGLAENLDDDSVDTVKASNAQFMVNNIQFTRSSNANLTDVIAGVTLNLASDAEGQSATVRVENDLTGAKDAIDNFVKEFNSLQSFLTEKTSITSDGNGNYTRGSLADDNIFSDLRMNLFSSFLKSVDGAGNFRSLRDIGIEIDDSLNVSIADPDLLEDALTHHMGDVETLMDSIMKDMDTTLSRYTETGGYIEGTLQSLDNELNDVNSDIEEQNDRLTDKQASLTQQYADLQSQLYMLQYTQQMISSLYGSSGSSIYG